MSHTKVIDKGWDRIRRELARANRLEVAVGIQEGTKNGDGFNVAEYAAANEYGTENIPSRPFMRTAFDENVPDITRDMQQQYAAICSGDRTAHQALVVIGQKHADRTKNTITNRDFLPALSPQTVKAKKGSTKTLVDTSAMVNGVQISVRGKTR